MTFTDAFAEPVSAPSAPGKPATRARASSARELLSKLEGAEREDLARALKARDLETVRAIVARHTDGARIERDSHAPQLEAPRPMMRNAGGAGVRRRAFKRASDDET